MEISPEKKVKLYQGLRIALIVFLAVIVASSFTNMNYDKYDNKPVNTISLSGHGEVQAVPDIANVDFTIRKEAKTVKDAQDAVSQVEKKVLDLLKTDNIADKDIKAQSVSFNPKYEYQYTGTLVPCNQFGCPPRPGQNVITGYEAYESISLKIRNTDDTGKVIQGLGTLGVTELNGPNFTVDNEDALKATARKSAIVDAQTKAKALANDLGIRLGKITSFSESGNYPVPMYAKAMMGATLDTASSAPAVVPAGENTISSDVTITYEIK